ncbi:MAG: DEAD/DEAH box helicase [Synechococcales bacterium]|nr:DEAD/DEAH box helicase [Synechococcales bacterium]
MAQQRKRVTRKQIRQTAKSKLGYDSLREGQEEAIAALLDGHDTLAVMPTGSGKSAIYQLAGALIPGSTVVISPLLALQQACGITSLTGCWSVLQGCGRLR